MTHRTTALSIAAAAALGISTLAQGATVINSGDIVDGWRISFPVGVSLMQEAGGTIELDKTTNFNSTEGLMMTFTQLSSTASPTITLLDDTVQNQTSSAFGAYQFLVGNPLPGNASDAQFASAAQTFTNIAPFTTTDFTPDNITLSGGTLGAGQSASFGGPGGGSLVIDANPAATGLKKVFEFKEIPSPETVPLPAALESGTSLLAGLGTVGVFKHLRRRRAV